MKTGLSNPEGPQEDREEGLEELQERDRAVVHQDRANVCVSCFRGGVGRQATTGKHDVKQEQKERRISSSGEGGGCRRRDRSDQKFCSTTVVWGGGRRYFCLLQQSPWNGVLDRVGRRPTLHLPNTALHPNRTIFGYILTENHREHPEHHALAVSEGDGGDDSTLLAAFDGQGHRLNIRQRKAERGVAVRDVTLNVDVHVKNAPSTLCATP